MKYFDVHSHIFPAGVAEKVIHQLESYYGFRWSGTGEQDDLMRSMREANVTRTVIFSCATKPAQVPVINDYISSLQREFPEQFTGFGSLHPDYSDISGEIRRMKELGLKGIKFHPDFQQFHIDDPRMIRVYEEIGDSMIMLFHMGDPKTEFSAPERLARVLDQLPGLKVIAAHMGGYQVWERAQKCLIGRDLYLDISSTIAHAGVEQARNMVLQHGADKVLFASDYPAADHKRAVAEVKSLGLPDDMLEMIFYRNAEKLLGVTL